jgi:hypothetical protein
MEDLENDLEKKEEDDDDQNIDVDCELGVDDEMMINERNNRDSYEIN